jgi:hypothetical protein
MNKQNKCEKRFFKVFLLAELQDSPALSPKAIHRWLGPVYPQTTSTV